MTITVNYRSGSSEQFTSVTDFKIEGDVVTITGTDAGGIAGTYILHWSDIQRILTQP